MGYLPSAIVNGFRGNYNLGIFLRLETPTPIRLWLGVAPILAELTGVDGTIDGGGVTYRGAGVMVDTPEMEVLFNGTADRVDFTLNGVAPDLAAYIGTGGTSVKGARTSLAVAPLDGRWQLPSGVNPYEIANGTADFVSQKQSPQTDPTKPTVRSITLATRMGDSARALPYYSMWTHNDQHRISSTDLFCDRTPRYVQTFMVQWPTF